MVWDGERFVVREILRNEDDCCVSLNRLMHRDTYFFFLFIFNLSLRRRIALEKI